MPLLGPEPYLGQGENDGDIAPHGEPALEVTRLRGPKIVFLGLEEPRGTTAILPSSDFSAKKEAPELVAQRITGMPYFSLDVSDVESSALDIVLRSNQLVKDGGQVRFSEARAAVNSMNWFDAAVFAQARSMVDWNSRNKVCTGSSLTIPCADVSHQFCSSCGSPVYSLWAGWKLACTTLLPWEANRAKKVGEKPCASSIGLNNFSHPRTDPVIITVPVNETGDKILLGRNVSGFSVLRVFTAGSCSIDQAKWDQPVYSALAGFMEPGEAFEDSIKRELWEEAGVKVWDIKYHSSQPWVGGLSAPRVCHCISAYSLSPQTSWSASMPRLVNLRN
jgi:NAD+ diphosphatase